MSTFLIENLDQEIVIPKRGILSKTVYKDSQLRAVLFGFAAGEELSEHSAPRPAIIHILKGQALVTLGTEEIQSGQGTWIYMSPGTPHKIVATAEMALILYLV